MQLHLNAIGNIPTSYPAVWFRVSTWARDCFVADFDNRADAERFAINDAKELRYDHKVSMMRKVK